MEKVQRAASQALVAWEAALRALYAKILRQNRCFLMLTHLIRKAFLLFLRRRRQLEPEVGALAHRALHPEGRAVGDQNRLDDREPQPAARWNQYRAFSGSAAVPWPW